MKLKCIMFALTALIVTNANARPYPDKVGVCYIFNGDNVMSKNACVIAYNDGAGGSTKNLIFSNKTYNIDGTETSYGYKYDVNGQPAKEYVRNASFYDVSTIQELDNLGEESLYCYKTKNLDLCHN